VTFASAASSGRRNIDDIKPPTNVVAAQPRKPSAALPPQPDVPPRTSGTCSLPMPSRIVHSVFIGAEASISIQPLHDMPQIITRPDSGFRFIETEEQSHGETVWIGQVEIKDNQWETYDYMFKQDVDQTIKELV
jgi:hypothetical protein